MKFARFLLAALLLIGLPAFADPVTYTAVLSGPAEFPPNASPGSGFTTVIIDTTAHTLSVDITFQDLVGITTASHIHCCTAVPGAGAIGVATELPLFTGFPVGVASGTYFHLFDTSLAGTYNPAFVTNNGGGTVAGAEAALAAGLDAGRAYLNIHSNIYPGGEIRGFLVPEPGTFILMGTGVLALALVHRRRLNATRG
jgi:hypothetical protein